MKKHDTSSASSYGVRTLLLFATVALALWGLAWTTFSGAHASAPVEPSNELAPPAVATRQTGTTSRPQVAVPARTQQANSVPAQPSVIEPTPAQTHAPRGREPERPDAISEQDQQTRMQERQMLLDRWQQQEAYPEVEPQFQATIAERLVGRALPANALATLGCRRTLCRFELASRGQSGLTPVSEVNELIAAVRDMGETWVLASEVKPGEWSVEAFAPTEGHTLTGPGIE